MLKIPEPEKLPSGSWRIRIQVNGQKYSITDKDKKIVKQRAKEIYAGAKVDKYVPMTVDQAMEAYIKAKPHVLSPATIYGYEKSRRNYLRGISGININKLTQEDVQKAVDADAARGVSPKTIRNAHGFLSAILKLYRPNFSLNTTLPQKEHYEPVIPEEDDMQKIWLACRGSEYELPILLGAWLGLRMSEIRGLKFSDIVDDKIHVQRAIVRGVPKDPKSKRKTESREKLTKSFSGDRWIKIPDTIARLIEKQPRRSELICPYSESAIYKNYKKACEKAGVEPTRFHDLRHFEASESHSIGVPDEYQIKRLGHKTDHMLKTTYRHVMKAKEDPFADAINEQMSTIFTELATKTATEKEKA